VKRPAIVALAWVAATSAAAQGGSYAERFAGVCAACHGASGVSTQALTPTLAGQPSFYAITQLFLFRDGRRDNAVMSAVAKGMSDDDLRGFSEAIAALPAPPLPAAPADAQRFERGAALAQRLHCTGCHGADLAGGKQVPRLAGQREDYLLHALRGFRAATRVGYGPAMTEALAGTTPQQLEDLAHHLAHAGAAGSRP
jgi:cytochrome c553